MSTASKTPITGKMQLALAVVGGLILAIAQPLLIEPISKEPIFVGDIAGLWVFVGWAPLLFVLHEVSVKRAYWLSVVFLVSKYAVVLYWLMIAMHVFGNIPVAIGIVLLLLLCMAIATGLAAPIAASRLMQLHYGYPLWLLFVMACGGGEFVRNWGILGGFPWGVDGAALARVPWMIQGASLVGVYGLGLFIMLVNAAVAETARFVLKRRPDFPRVVVGLSLGGFVLFGAWGAYRLSTFEESDTTVKVALLQGNIDQGIKNKDRLNRETIAKRYHALQGRAIEAGADVVVWPEAAVPGGVVYRRGKNDLKRGRAVARRGPYKGLTPKAAIIGASVFEMGEGREVKALYNSAFITGPGLEERGRFDKSHLVPFGEYVPWPLGPIVRQVVPGGSAVPGVDLKPLPLRVDGNDILIGTTICYEGIFPEITREFANAGAELMFNVTNDAWYGVSSASAQHFDAYIIRAVESARPVARAANTGYSGWIDARGRVRARSDLYVDDLLLVDVPTSTETTPYMVIGDKIPFVLICIALLLWFNALCGPAFWRRKRDARERWVGVTGAVIAVATLVVHFIIAPPLGDEARSTQHQLIFIFSTLVSVGAFSGRPWGRKAQMWTGGLGVVCVVGAFVTAVADGFSLGTAFAFVLGAMAVAVGVIARRRRDAYTREAQTQVAHRAESA